MTEVEVARRKIEEQTPTRRKIVDVQTSVTTPTDELKKIFKYYSVPILRAVT